MSYFISKTMLYTADFASLAAIVLSIYCYVFQVQERSGYVMDGVAFTVCVFAGLFGLVVNRFNHAECDRIHS